MIASEARSGPELLWSSAQASEVRAPACKAAKRPRSEPQASEVRAPA